MRAAHLLLLLAPMSAAGIFSQFEAITPENAKHRKIAVSFGDAGNQSSFKVTVRGLTYRDVWLVTLNKALPPDEQNFRNLIWNNKREFGGTRVVTVRKVFEFHDPQKLPPPLPPIEVKKDEAATTYLYMDHPEEVADGGFYYTIDLPAFYALYKDRKSR